jgi:hypothetical protein
MARRVCVWDRDSRRRPGRSSSRPAPNLVTAAADGQLHRVQDNDARQG